MEYVMSRTGAYEYNGRGDVGANGEVRANGSQYGRFTFDMSGLRTALGDRLIKVNNVTFGWNTSAKFTYNVYFNTASSSDGVYAGSAKGNSTTYKAWTGFNTDNASVIALIEQAMNESTDANTAYFTLYKSGSAGGNGYCQYGDIAVYYELGAPRRTTIIDSITTDKDVALKGDAVTFSAQVYNTQASSVTNAHVEFFCVVDGSEVAVAAAQDYPVNIPTMESRIFGGTITLSNSLTIARGSQIRIRITITGTGVTAAQTTDFMKYIDKYYAPSIKAFALWRCSDVTGTMQRDDSGVEIMTDLQIGLNAQSAGSFTLKAYYAENESVDTSVAAYVDLNLATNFASLIAGVSDDTTLITRTGDFSNGSNWFFRMVLTDGIETASADLSVPCSEFNFHLAGLSTGGVAFGMASKSTQGHPKLECKYPAEFYGDVTIHGNLNGGFDYSTTEKRTPYKWIDGKPIYRTVFANVSTPSGGDAAIANLSNYSEVDHVISLNGFSTNSVRPLQYHLDNDYFTAAWYSKSDGNIMCTRHGFVPETFYVVIEYTKTTDQGVS